MSKKTIFTTLMSVIIVAIITFICIPNLSLAIVMSGSMEDGISVNDVVVAVKQSDYKVKDIVSYKSGSMLVTHRIIDETETGYITKGDANNTEDGEVAKGAIVGKVIFVIPKIGSIIYFFKTPLGMLVLFSLLLVIYKFPSKKKGGDMIEEN